MSLIIRTIEALERQVSNLERLEEYWTKKAGTSKCGRCARQRDNIRKSLAAAKAKLEKARAEKDAS